MILDSAYCMFGIKKSKDRWNIEVRENRYFKKHFWAPSWYKHTILLASRRFFLPLTLTVTVVCLWHGLFPTLFDHDLLIFCDRIKGYVSPVVKSSFTSNERRNRKKPYPVAKRVRFFLGNLTFICPLCLASTTWHSWYKRKPKGEDETTSKVWPSIATMRLWVRRHRRDARQYIGAVAGLLEHGIRVGRWGQGLGYFRTLIESTNVWCVFRLCIHTLWSFNSI